VPPASRPQWQQATALITIGAGGVATGLTFVPKAAADLTSPASVPPVTLLALEHAKVHAPGRDAMLRAAIVHMARHFLRLAQTRSPAEMEAMIWQYASTDGVNHGPSCAAFASLALELGSHIAGLDSWVTGGTSYPWPVHAWVDGRVDPNPASPGVVSVLQDAQSHGRWHPLGDGYTPQAGDWVLFDGHVEVVTKYHGGVLHTIGGDSLPNMSVNAHAYTGPMQDQGVAGFVDNGVGMSGAQAGPAHARHSGKHGERGAAIPGIQPAEAPVSSADPPPSARAGSRGTGSNGAASAGPGSSARRVSTGKARGQQRELGPRAIPAPPTVPWSRSAQISSAQPAQAARAAAPGGYGSSTTGSARTAQATRAAAAPQRQSARPPGKASSQVDRAARPADQRPQHAGRGPQRGDRHRAMTADVPATGLRPARPHHARPGQAAIPGLFKGAHGHHPGDASALPPYHRHDVPPSNAPQPGTATQQAFIKQVASGAMDTQRRYGVPASVTIAQAIDESGWGQSVLATNDHNLFGIKGTGPAGSDEQPTQEVINGQLVNLSASFQIYENIAQSIDAHGRLLAHSGDYANAMSRSKDPNAFAAALTGVYATDPTYGAKLIQLMQQYDLYRYDHAAARAGAPGHGAPTTRRGPDPARPARRPGAAQSGGGHHPADSAQPQASPGPRQQSPGRDRTPKPRQPGPIGNPVPVQPAPIAGPRAGQPAPIGVPVPPQPGPPAAAQGGRPARGTKAGPAGRQAGAPRSGQAAEYIQAPQHDVATPPVAVLYPGRSTRPAPLAHPAPPAGRTRPSSPAPGNELGAARTQTRSQRPGQRTRAAPGQASGTEPGAANMSGDAAIPGVPHAVVAQPASAPPHRPIGRPRPADPNSRPAAPTSGAQIAGPAGARNTATAPTGQPKAPGRAPAAPARPAAASPAPVSGAPLPPPANPVPAASTPTRGGADVPGLVHRAPAAARTVPAGPAGNFNAGSTTAGRIQGKSPQAVDGSAASGTAPRASGGATLTVYHAQMPPSVREAFVRSAKTPLLRAEHLYRDVAGHTGIRWELLAACDWMQCKARQGYSPVYGEKLGALNPDDTCYRTKSAALEQCASDLLQLARSVYQLDIVTNQELTVRDLANVFAAYRWGGLLRQHCTSAMDFPYSVAGLTADHTHMRWPNIDESNAPDKPGSRFRQPFGAVPVVLGLNYQALM
jgi:flagellum-specific peptidoglycan hydrolase FlgJ